MDFVSVKTRLLVTFDTLVGISLQSTTLYEQKCLKGVHVQCYKPCWFKNGDATTKEISIDVNDLPVDLVFK